MPFLPSHSTEILLPVYAPSPLQTTALLHHSSYLSPSISFLLVPRCRICTSPFPFSTIQASLSATKFSHSMYLHSVLLSSISRYSIPLCFFPVANFSIQARSLAWVRG